MTLESVTTRCECGAVTTTSWEVFKQTLWADVTSCECCGDSVLVRGEVTCSSCGLSLNVHVHGA